MIAESLESRKSSPLEPVFQIQDESFKKEDSGNYKLSVRFGSEGFSYSVLDSKRNKFILVKIFDFGKNLPELSWEQKIEDLLQSDEILKLNYFSVNASFVSETSTLVPAAIFEDKNKAAYLGFNHPGISSDLILADFISFLDTWVVFSIPEKLSSLLKSKFNGIRFHHYSSSLLAAIPAKNKNVHEKKIALHVQKNSFDIIVTEGGKLQFFNSFRYRSPEDFMYFLVFACDRLKLNPEKTEVVLFGEIVKTSGIYSLLTKYFRNIRFSERNEAYQYSYGFTDVPSHFYFNLLNQLLCE